MRAIVMEADRLGQTVLDSGTSALGDCFLLEFNMIQKAECQMRLAGAAVVLMDALQKVVMIDTFKKVALRNTLQAEVLMDTCY